MYGSSSNISISGGLKLSLSTLDIRSMPFPTIVYRPMRPSDLEALEQIHAALFPIRYEREFFINVVNGLGIVSWAAVAVHEPDGQNVELIGFVTARTIATKDSEIEDLISYDRSRKDPTLVYILTLGVVERYRNRGIASSLIQEVINYASSIANCRAVYLHVIAYNNPAIHFYKKMLFKLARRLPKFYYINGQHYDSYLFVYYVNGGRSPCSPLPSFLKRSISLDGRIDKLPSHAMSEERSHIVAAVVTYIRGLLKFLYAKVWKHDEKISRWSKCKETNTLLVTHNARILGSENALCQAV